MVRQAAASVRHKRRSPSCDAPLLIAREFYLAHSGFETAFGLHAACIGAQIEACAKEDIPPLAAAYGPAEIDKAISGCAACAASVPTSLTVWPAISQASMRGCRAISRMRILRAFWPGVSGWSVSRIRHTVGMDDTVEGEGGGG